MKNLRIRLFCVIAIAMAVCGPIMGQKATFEQVLSMELRNSGTIQQGNEIIGYYLFYKEDKIDRKTNQYRLRVLDANLKEIASESIIGSSTMYLMESCFNGTNLGFKFIELKEEKFRYRIYDTAAKLVKQVDFVANKIDIQIGYQAIEHDEVFEGTFFEVPNKGFASLKMTKEGHFGFEIQYLGKDRGFLGWTYKSDPASKMMEFADFLIADENMLIFQVLKKKNLLSSEMDAYLLGIDVNTGKKKFENKLVDATNSFFLLNGIREESSGNYLFFGQHTPIGDNSFTNKNLGFSALQVDPAGKVVKTTKVSWATDVVKFLPVNQKGKIEDAGYVFFHKIVRLADGRTFAIGEQFKKTVSASGVAVAALGGSAALLQMTIEDIMIFEFSKEFKLQGVSVFEKGKSRFQLPQGAGFNGPQRLAHYVKALGGFDYSFTQVPNDRSSFTACFQDWEKEKGEKGRMTLKSVTPSSEGYTTDKIDLETEASFLWVQPAKQGYVLVSEYFRKLKKMESRLEKFNL